MTEPAQTNREQLKRAVEAVLDPDVNDTGLTRGYFARHCLTLLAELEQAEKQIVRIQNLFAEQVLRSSAAESRLAKVPPLVEAAEMLAGAIELPVESKVYTARQHLIEILAAWETE